MHIQKVTALVTGAASGLGRAAAGRLLRQVKPPNALLAMMALLSDSNVMMTPLSPPLGRPCGTS